MKSGRLNLLEPSGPHRACYGTHLPYNNMHCDIRGFRSRVAEDLNLLVTAIIELLDHEYDGTTILRNVANYVAKNTASRARRCESSVSSISTVCLPAALPPCKDLPYTVYEAG
jgi:hypothetical protein